MNRTILAVCLNFALIPTLLLCNNIVQAQKITKIGSGESGPGEQLERTLSFWSLTMEQARAEVGATNQEYAIFKRFCRHSLDSVYIEFLDGVNAKTIGPENVKEYVRGKKPYLVDLFNKFRKIEQEFPSSVAEYRTEPKPRLGGDSCFSNCYNTGFEDGTFDGWYGYYGQNNSPNNNVGPFNIIDVTGGYCGPVKKAAGPDIYTGNDYQLRITSGAATDWFLNTYSTYSQTQVSPFGGSHSVMMGDSTRNGYGVSILSQSFLVTPNTASLTYQYSVFLENPTGHDYYAQPFFSVVVLDQNGDTIPICGQYAVDGDSGTAFHFKGIWYSPELDSVYWKPWTLVNVPLRAYVGQCVTILFQVQDCSLGGHFGYAYVDASCSPLQLISSSPNFCGQDSISLTAPPGGASYTWFGPGLMNGDSTTQTVWVDSAGVYKVIVVPVTGVACADTLYDSVGKAPGPPPHPKIYADTACAGSPTKFFNITPYPFDTGKFSWDFYNIGVYNLNDTNNFNPTWTYASPGIYHVKINEIYNGCGFDTVIAVVVDTVPVAAFTASNACINTPITFINTTTGTNHYSWNFGFPPHDTSTAVSPVYTYTTAGTYTVTLIVTNAGGCNDTIEQAVTIYDLPNPKITGDTVVCPGEEDTLTVTGGTTWAWSNGATTSTIHGTISTTTTYTVTAYNGDCAQATTVTVHVLPAPTASITPTKDSVCKGDTLTLFGKEGVSYRWSNGTTSTISTDSLIHLTLNSDTTIILYTKVGTCVASDTITLKLIKPITATAKGDTSICPGNPVNLTATVGGSSATAYRWYPGGGSTPVISVSPTVTTTYTSVVVGKCDSVTNKVTVTVVPLPIPIIKATSPFECKGSTDVLTVSSTVGPTTYKWSDGKTTTSYTTGPIEGDSTITVTATNSLGCSVDTTITIFVRIPPSITFTATTVCSGECLTLKPKIVSNPSATSYLWNTGATTDTLVVCPTSATNYSLTVSNGCSTNKSTTVSVYADTITACCDTTIIIGDTAVLSANSSTTYNWYPSTGLNCDTCHKVIATPSVTTSYTVVGTDIHGCSAQMVLTVIVDIPCFNFTVPNVFTPDFAGPVGSNGGTNNELYIKTENIEGWSMVIYDRWGKEMYKSSNPESYWMGTTESGANAPDGVYYYIINASCQQTTYKKDGFVQLIR